MNRAIGISVHTGWGACVLVGGSIASPEIVANQVIEILGDLERFCFHIAAAMERTAAEEWIARARRKAVANARRALAASSSRMWVFAQSSRRRAKSAVLAMSCPRIRAFTQQKGISTATPFATHVLCRCTSYPPRRSIFRLLVNSRRRLGEGIRNSLLSPPGEPCGANPDATAFLAAQER